MFFQGRSEAEKLAEVQNIVSSITSSSLTEGTAKSLLEAFEGFENFVDSGKTFKSLREDFDNQLPNVGEEELKMVGSLSSFISARGGSLMRNEVWILFAYLFWRGHCMAVDGEEGKLIRELKASVLEESEGTAFKMNANTGSSFKKLISHWLGQKEK